MFDHIEFLLSEAMTALRRNIWMTFAAITTSCMALFLTGGVGFAYKGISEYAGSLPSKFEMRVFLADTAKKPEVDRLSGQIKKLSGVQSVSWLSKEVAWKKFRTENPDFPTQGIENPLPETLVIKLNKLEEADRIATAIRKMPGVASDGVQYLKQEREMLTQALNFLRTLGLTLGSLMVLTSAILIYNAIRMTIVARRREFRIMHLVGANTSTVTLPLLLEGMVQGGVGGFLAACLVQGTHWYLSEQLKAFSGIVKLGNLNFQAVLFTLLVAGIAYGLVCSFIAIRDYREKE